MAISPLFATKSVFETGKVDKGVIPPAAENKSAMLDVFKFHASAAIFLIIKSIHLLYSLMSHLLQNLHKLQVARSYLAIVSGIAAGILQLESSFGFLFYFLASLGLSLTLLASTGFQSETYLPKHYWFYQVFDNLFSYVLFWTLTFNLDVVYK
jgi:hypothetical protein